MTLHTLLSNYLSTRETSPRYRESLTRTVRALQKYGIEKICQLHPDRLNKFLADLPLGAVTKGNYRREILTLWRFAYEEGMSTVPPLRLRRIRVSYAPPRTWSYAQLCQILYLAERDETRVSGRLKVRVCDLLPAWFATGYDTGIRLSDLLVVKWANVRNDCLFLSANKTGKPLVRRLSPTALKYLDKVRPLSTDSTVFLWAMPRRRAILTVKGFLTRHKLEGGTQWLRRAAATQLENEKSGSATRFLQHSNPDLARKHYIDESLLDPALQPKPLFASAPPLRPMKP